MSANSPKNTPQNPTLMHLGELAKEHSRTRLPLPESRRDSGLEVALRKLGEAIRDAERRRES